MAVLSISTVVILVCLWFLAVPLDDAEVPTERSRVLYSCRCCKQQVSRGETLKYMHDAVLCDRCWIAQQGRLPAPDASFSRRRARPVSPLAHPMMAIPMTRSAALLIVFARRRR